MAAVIQLLVAGAAAGQLAWVLLRGFLAHPALERSNAAGRRLPTAGGLVLVVVAAGVAVWGRSSATRADGALAVGVVVLGLGGLGFLDDVLGEKAGSGGPRGLGGHLRELRRGRVTTGLLKLVGSPLVALAAVSAAPLVSDPLVPRLLVAVGGGGSQPFIQVRAPTAVADPTLLVAGERPLASWLLAVVLVALAANLANLFDRAPGRAAKVSLACAAPLLVLATRTGLHDEVAGAAVVLGAAGFLLFPDLREKLMLGDTGAGALGGTVGLLAAMVLAAEAQVAAVAVLLALTLASEKWSFSAVIERVGLLRALDRWGRPAR